MSKWSKNTETPETPYTGTVENSGMGLFVSKTAAQIIVSLNDKETSEAFRNAREELDSRIKDGDATFGISLAVNSQKPLSECNGNFEGVSVQGVSLSCRVTSQDEKETYIEVTSLVPVNIFMAWCRELGKNPLVEHLELAIIDVWDQKNSVEKLETMAGNEGILLKPDILLGFEFTPDFREEALSDYELLSSVEIADAVFGHINYRKEPMYSILLSGRGEEE